MFLFTYYLLKYIYSLTLGYSCTVTTVQFLLFVLSYHTKPQQLHDFVLVASTSFINPDRHWTAERHRTDTGQRTDTRQRTSKPKLEACATAQPKNQDLRNCLLLKKSGWKLFTSNFSATPPHGVFCTFPKLWSVLTNSQYDNIIVKVLLWVIRLVLPHFPKNKKYLMNQMTRYIIYNL